MPLTPYQASASAPWNAQRVRHLYKRMGVAATADEVTQGLSLAPQTLVSQVLAKAVNETPPAPPFWANYTDDDYPDDDVKSDHMRQLKAAWLRRIVEGSSRAKWTLFWHNHFVTQYEIYFCNALAYDYYSTLNSHALADFRPFVEAMGTASAMLHYLNGRDNIAAEPNENYARELMELFTMGENNGYTQTDVVEVSRALTGWRSDPNYNCENRAFFDPSLHDNGQKTIFGQQGNFGYAEVHDLIFSLRQNQTAEYICGKLYKQLCYATPDEQVVDQLATMFKASGFNIETVVGELVASEHFFSERIIGAQIKSPLELFAHLFRVLGLEGPLLSEDALNASIYFSALLGQDLFDPIDVAGWPGHHDWLNENTLATRWELLTRVVIDHVAGQQHLRTHLRDLAIQLSNTTTEYELVVDALIAHCLNTQLTDVQREGALVNFRGDIPINYYQDGTWNMYFDEVPDQIVNLLLYLIRQPEWQLC